MPENVLLCTALCPHFKTSKQAMDFICIMRLLLYLALSCGLVQVTKSSITSGFTASLIHGSSSLSESKTDRIDASLYSRQLFVYGESAQRKLKDAHVLLIGSTLLVHEIGKNLALAGVGNLYVQSAALHTSPRLSIIAESQSLSHYLKTLNPNIQVCSICTPILLDFLVS